MVVEVLINEQENEFANEIDFQRYLFVVLAHFVFSKSKSQKIHEMYFSLTMEKEK